MWETATSEVEAAIAIC